VPPCTNSNVSAAPSQTSHAPCRNHNCSAPPHHSCIAPPPRHSCIAPPPRNTACTCEQPPPALVTPAIEASSIAEKHKAAVNTASTLTVPTADHICATKARSSNHHCTTAANGTLAPCLCEKQPPPFTLSELQLHRTTASHTVSSTCSCIAPLCRRR